MRLPWVLALGLIAGSLGSIARAEVGPKMICRPDAIPSAAQRSERLTAALAPIEAEHTAALAALDRDPPPDADDRTEALLRDYHAAKRRALEPLAAEGDANSMMRLADDIRESEAPDEAARWLSLVQCASDLGDPLADDELARWWWHRRGDGSIEQVQANRAKAMAFAGKAADAGYMWGVSRIATYVAGNLHQYPADLPLARRLMELCARTGDAWCEEQLAGGSSYDYGQSPRQLYLWLSQLSMRQPERFAARRDLVWSRLPEGERAAARRELQAWRPTPWAVLQPQWREVQEDILRHGAISTGL